MAANTSGPGETLTGSRGANSSTPAGGAEAPADAARLIRQLRARVAELESRLTPSPSAPAADPAAYSADDSAWADLAGLACLTLDAGGAVVRCNAGAARVLGIQAERIRGRRLRWFVAADDRLALDAFLNQVTADDRIQECDLTFSDEANPPRQVNVRARGGASACHVILTAAIGRSGEGGATNDIDTELRESQRLAGVGNWSWTVGADRAVWSRGVYDIFQLDPSQPAPSLSDRPARYTPESWERIDAAVARVLADATPYELDLEFIRHDGTTGWLTARGEAETDVAGKVVKLRGTVQDITRRKRAEAELEANKARLSFLLTATTAVIYTCRVSGDWGCTFVSENVESLTGHKVECFMEQPGFWVQHLHPDDAPRVLADLGRLEESDRHVHEYRFLHADGRYRWLHDEVRLVRDAAGRPVEAVGFFKDVTERRREQQLMEEMQKIARVGSWSLDLVTRDLWWSRQTFVLHELPPDGPTPMLEHAIHFYAPEARPVIAAAVERAVAEGSEWDLELPLITATGRRIWVRAQGKVELQDGRPVRAFGAFQDITSRREAEAALRQSEARARLFIENATDALFLHEDYPWRVVDVSPLACQWLGYTRNQLIGMHPSDFDPLATPEMLQALQARLNAESTVMFESEHRRSDGTVFPVEVRLRRFESEGRRQVVAFVRDISERKASEARLAESERWFRTLAEYFPDPIFVLDPSDPSVPLKILYVNPAVRKTHGYAPEELIGQSLLGRLNEPGAAALAPERLRRIMAGEVIEFETTHIHRDGREIPIEVRGGPIPWQGRNMILSIDRDISERKASQARLADSEQWFRTLAEYFPDPIFVLDPHHESVRLRIMYVNPAVEKTHGYRPEELIGQSMLDFLNLPVAAGHGPGRIRRILAGEVIAFDSLHRHKDGRVVPIEVTAGPVPWRGQTMILSINRDVSARKAGEAALRLSDERFHLLARATRDVVWDLDLTNHRVWRNENYESFGHPAGTVAAEFDAWRALIHPDDQPGVVAGIRTTLAGGLNHWAGEYRLRRANGSYADVLDRAFIIRDSSGTAVRMVGALIDLSDRKAAEAELRLLKTCVERLSDLVIICVPEAGPLAAGECPLRVIYVNQAFVDRTGFDRDAAIGRHADLLGGPNTQPDVSARIKADIAAGKTSRGELLCYTRAGQEFWLDCEFSPVQSETACITHWVAVMRDVTRQRQADELASARQAELTHLARLNTMGQMATGLAHEINQPLAATMNYAGALRVMTQSGAATPDQTLETLDEIIAQTRRAGEVIRRIRQFVRREQPDPLPVDLAALAVESIKLLEFEIRAAFVTVSTQAPPALPAVRADAVQIQQVLVNLIRNACDAMSHPDAYGKSLVIAVALDAPEDDTVDVDSPAPAFVRVDITDQGPGVPHHILPQLFDPFFTTKPDGLGMGLAISRSIIEDAGGTLEALNHPSGGMTFRLRLPVG